MYIVSKLPCLVYNIMRNLRKRVCKDIIPTSIKGSSSRSEFQIQCKQSLRKNYYSRKSNGKMILLHNKINGSSLLRVKANMKCNANFKYQSKNMHSILLLLELIFILVT